MRNKKNISLYLLSSIAFIVIILSAAVIGLAWAKYLNSSSEQSSAEIAKWSFKLVGGTTDTSGIIHFPITRTDSNTCIEQGVLAPRYIWRI